MVDTVVTTAGLWKSIFKKNLRANYVFLWHFVLQYFHIRVVVVENKRYLVPDCIISIASTFHHHQHHHRENF